jgi:uncharacterized protein
MRTLLLVTVATLVISAGLAGSAEDAHPLVAATKAGDLRAVQRELQAHRNPNEAEADGTTALNWAIEQNRTDIAQALIAAGADVNASNHFSMTPLAVALTNGNSAMTEMLLKAGANPRVPVPELGTPLLAAAHMGNTNAIKALLRAGVDVNETETASGQTALMHAANEGHADAVKSLIAGGADVKKRSSKEETALFFAVRKGSTSVVDALLAAGADVNERAGSNAANNRRNNSSKADVPGDSMLVVAIANAHFSLADFLLEKGADPNLLGANWTALHALARVRNYEEMQYPPPKITPGDLDSLELAKHLIQHGANLNTRGGPQAVRRAGGDQNYKDLLGATPFFLAAKSGDVPYMRLLAAAGADITIPEEDNTTPLMVAAGVGCVPGQWIEPEKDVLGATKLLVEDLKADVNAQNKEKETALHGAVCRGADSVIHYLVDHGAKLDIKDEDGQTPLDIAMDGLNRAVSINGPRIIIFRFPDHTIALMKNLAERSGGIRMATGPSLPATATAAQVLDRASVWDRVYTSAQADRGKALFSQQCSVCHGEALEGKNGPALAAASFKSDFEGLMVDDLFEYVQKSMPRGNTGTLSREQTTDLVAFLLTSNGFPSGTKDLPGEAPFLKKIRFETKKSSN